MQNEQTAQNTAIALNTAKETNATHTGDVTGATTLTISDGVVKKQHLDFYTPAVNGYAITWNSTQSKFDWKPVASEINALIDGKTVTTSVFLGTNAGAALTAANKWNTGVGDEVLKTNTNGMLNTAIGYNALKMNNSNSNTAVGTYSLDANTSGNSNTGLGYNTLSDNTIGSLNTAVGNSALKKNTEGSWNVVIGSAALQNNISGQKNVVIGSSAGANTLGSENVFIGHYSGFSETGSNKLYIESSDAINGDYTTPLIYGEFDNDLVRINGKQEITGTLKIEGGNPGVGKVLTSDTDGLASWTTPVTIPNGTNVGDQLVWDGTQWAITPADNSDLLPKLTTSAATSITSVSAISGGTITADGGYSIISKGVFWGTSPNPTISDSSTDNGSGASSFTSNLASLSPATTYYYRAYATNSIGTGYGMTFTLTTPTLSSLSTTAVSAITSTTANSGGTITDNGGSTITVSGIVWGTTTNPTTATNTGSTTNGATTGSFSSNLTGLAPATTYYVRAYATNAAGTAYGNEVTFTTTATIASISTTAASAITSTTATSGGAITANGGSTITVSGIVWGTTTNPTTATNTGSTTNGATTGSFTSNLTGLAPATTYYVRAYATNAIGTAYGNEITFTTAATLASLSTTAASAIAVTTATSGGTITSNGGSTITVSGIVWNTTTNPTTATNTGSTTNGTTTGNFTSNLTGLTAGTTYYVRAYATNIIGTAYGNEITFTTTNPPTFATGTVHCNNPTAIVEVLNPVTGKIWMDRNLGASQVATSATDSNAYGDLYQWGRNADGHQCRNSATTSVLSSTNNPGHGNFITTPSYQDFWLSTNQFTGLWLGVNGTNNPCPSSFRLPTIQEIIEEQASWTSQNSNGAFNSPLKLTLAGFRTNTGTINNPGVSGYYFSSNINPSMFRIDTLGYASSYSQAATSPFGFALSVRCIKN